MLPGSEVVLAQFDTQENRWTFYDVYKVARNHTLEMSVLGWLNGRTNGNNSLQLNEESHKMIARKNLKGLRLRCGSLVSAQQHNRHTINVVSIKMDCMGR